MITLEFSDGVAKDYKKGTTAFEVVKDHFKREEGKAVAAKIDGTPIDLSRELPSGKFEVIASDTAEGLDIVRHSSSHVMALAIKRHFPNALITIGPSVEDGFYYDFDNLDLKEDDFPKIEEEIHKILHERLPFSREEVSHAEALKKFSHQPYKLELINELPKGEIITVYKLGEFEDLCRGPHVPHTGKIGAIKLMKLAGAYWRGDSKNKMLTRVYGTSFPEKKMLQEYLARLEEAKKRDHRKIGRDMDLFVFSDLVGPGLPLWTPRGTLIRDLLDQFIWELRRERGYQKVTIPHITKKELYETSGHWSKFKDDLFRITTREGHLYAMKPMNCPHHTQIYASRMRSYKDLPQRYAETTMVYRDEQTGELSGLQRVLSITQDDAHVFCRKSQIQEEFNKVWDIIETFYKSFGFQLRIRLSFHDSGQMEKYLGSQDLWKAAEAQLRQIVKARDAAAQEAPGEAAFYGPKIDFMAKDSMGREWQVATIQLDFNMPNRFGLYCINEAGEKEPIFMIHCAIMGSIERFTSILIEHFAGKFPIWLNPVQVKILPITDNHIGFSRDLSAKMKKDGIRVEIDERSESTSKKVRDAQLEKVNYILVIGDREVEGGSVNIRTRNNELKGSKTVEEFISQVLDEIQAKAPM
jgi:threonyl-tRNA synthetase